MLKARNITIKFGGLIAVNNVSLDVKDGQITCLIGPNGAGKTTFFNSISGVHIPDSGTVEYNGQPLQGKRGFQINKAGISRTYQVINLFKKMTVRENVMVGMHCRLKTNFLDAVLHTKRQRQEERGCVKNADELLKFVGLLDKGDDPAGSLSYGEQRLLEIIRGLASNPGLLLLDEPAAGMNASEKAELHTLLRKIVDRNVSILMIEHDMKLVMGIADYVYVLERGKLLAEGKPEEVQRNPDVIAAYLGGE